MQHQGSACVDYLLKPVRVHFHRLKSRNFAYALSVSDKILLPRIFSEDRPFQADRVVLIYKWDEAEIKEENRLWRSHFDQVLYPSCPEDMLAYLFDDFADLPTNMRKCGAIISKIIKPDAVHEWNGNPLPKPSSCIVGKTSYKAQELEHQILQRVRCCLAKEIPYSSDPITNALQFKYIQKFT